MRGVKVISYKNSIVTLKIEGQLLSYLVDRPQPLGPADAVLLQSAMDTTFLKSMFDLASPPSRMSKILSWFAEQWRHGGRTTHFNWRFVNETVADYIEKVGVEVNIDEKTKALVILKSDVVKIRKGDLR